jgi:hypothetical protein
MYLRALAAIAAHVGIGRTRLVVRTGVRSGAARKFEGDHRGLGVSPEGADGQQ